MEIKDREASMAQLRNQSECPICLNSNVHNLFRVDKFPYFTVPVTEDRKREILSTHNFEQLQDVLEVNCCNSCHHCFLGILPDMNLLDELYAKYYSYPSALSGGFNPERELRFLDFFDNRIEPMVEKAQRLNVLEVGCYDGYILHQLQKKGYNVLGCDPSEGAEIGKSHGVQIFREFFDSERFVEREHLFDIVISRHFIEHVVDPCGWVKKLGRVLSPGGLLVLETPNVRFYLENGLPEVFSLQHLHGFSSTSLYHAVRRSGLATVYAEETPGNILVAAVDGGSVRPSEEDDGWQGLVDRFENILKGNIRKASETVQRYIDAGKGISIWGAGGFCSAAIEIYGIPADCIDCIIDTDPQKSGMAYLNLAIPIVTPVEAIRYRPDLIIIASMYAPEIKETISRLQFNCGVLSLFPVVSFS